MTKKITIAVLILILFQSCECWFLVNGYVVDSQTKEPIEGVNLEYLNVKSEKILRRSGQLGEVRDNFITDSTGFFFMQSDNYGLCPDIEPRIRIWKAGYQTKELTVQDNTTDQLSIELEKL